MTGRRLYAQHGGEMTPPSSIREHAKHLALRKVLDRVRPLAFRKWTGGVRCLTFHYLFEDERDHAYRVFSALKREGDFITTSELLACLHGPPVGGRLFHLSVDDGFENIATVAHPILRGLEIPYSLMVCPTFVGADETGLEGFRQNARYAGLLRLADWRTLAGLAAEGVEIGAHTMSHRELSGLSGKELETEIVEPKRIIEERIGRPCQAFAWPFGRRTAISEEGLRLAERHHAAVFSSVRGSLALGGGVPRYLPRHHFEPSWPLATTLYYATRAEPDFELQGASRHA